MKVLLVHLSDIHIRSGEDAVLTRAKSIASAVRDREPDVRVCFVVISGDTAFSGVDEQYSAAIDFMVQVREELASYFRSGAPVRFIVVPGNHDCDFSVATGVRKRLLSGIEANPQDASDEDVIEGCTTVQADFFEYLHVLSEENLEQQNKLYYEYRFTFEGQSFLFRCYNTAWMSQLHEQQGHLVFPLDKAAGKQNGFDLVVSVLHHPFNWMQSENARALKNQVEEASDVILTGHEHDNTYQLRLGVGVERNHYIEGGVLQESSDAQVSTFNALIVDLEAEKQSFSILLGLTVCMYQRSILRKYGKSSR